MVRRDATLIEISDMHIHIYKYRSDMVTTVPTYLKNSKTLFFGELRGYFSCPHHIRVYLCNSAFNTSPDFPGFPSFKLFDAFSLKHDFILHANLSGCNTFTPHVVSNTPVVLCKPINRHFIILNSHLIEQSLDKTRVFNMTRVPFQNCRKKIQSK